MSSTGGTGGEPARRWIQVPSEAGANGPSVVSIPSSDGSTTLKGRVQTHPGSGGEIMFFPIAPLPARSLDSSTTPAVRSVAASSVNRSHLASIATSGIPPDVTIVGGAGNENGKGIGMEIVSPLTDSAGFLGDVDPNFEDSEYPPGPGRKKRKTPAFQLSSGRHDGCAVYDGDVVDGTDRHNKLPPIMLDPLALDGGDGGDEDGQNRLDGDEGGFRERYGRDQDDDDERAYTKVHEGSDPNHPTHPSQVMANANGNGNGSGRYPPLPRLLKPPATQTCEFRKLLFLRRKAALITLFLDATSAIKSYWKDEKSASTANMSKNLLSKLPEVDSFEKLLPALEDVGVGGWPPDQPDWRAGEEGKEAFKKYGSWRGRFAKRTRTKEGRREIVRGGWAPEGSFEFERPSSGRSHHQQSRSLA